MAIIEGTPEYKVAKITIAEKLQEELENNYNNIKSYVDSYQQVQMTLNTLSSEFSNDPEFSSKFDDLVSNIEHYVPSLETLPDGTNLFLDEVKNVLGDSFESFNEGSVLLDTLNISSLDDLANLTDLSDTFLDTASQSILNGSFQSIMTDFNLQEVGIGSILSIADHNLNIQSITDSITNVTAISENLIDNFQDVANMEAIQGMLNDIPTSLSNLAMDKLGNLDLNQMLTDAGIPNLDDIQNILNVKDLMSGVIGNISGQISGMLNGIGGCGCAAAVGGFGDLSGMMQNMSNQFMGKLNSTMDSIMNSVPIGGYADVMELADSMKGQLDQIKDITTDWKDILPT